MEFLDALASIDFDKTLQDWELTTGNINESRIVVNLNFAVLIYV